jgi:hypothetical protein
LPLNEQPKTYCLLLVKLSECTHLCTIVGRKKSGKKFQEKNKLFLKKLFLIRLTSNGWTLILPNFDMKRKE